jgi:hypothetical protein
MNENELNTILRKIKFTFTGDKLYSTFPMVMLCDEKGQYTLINKRLYILKKTTEANVPDIRYVKVLANNISS